MKARFAGLIVISLVAVAFYARPIAPWASVVGLLLAGIPFVLSRPMLPNRVLFRSEPLDERERSNLNRTDSLAITIFFGTFLTWLLLGLALSTAFEIQMSRQTLGRVTVALQTIPGFVLIHSVCGLVIFARR